MMRHGMQNTPLLAGAIKRIMYVVCLGLVLPVSLLSQADEYTVKAVMLERFARFVEWPEILNVSDTTQPFIVGIIGENPFGSKPENIYSEQKIKNKKVSVRYISGVDEIGNCNLLFISGSEKTNLSRILSFTKNKPILTVSDTEGFAKAGVLINLFLNENKVNFEINEAAVRESGLSMSYLLLKAGKIVTPAR